MDCTQTTYNVLSLFIPGIIAIIGNIVFYIIVKSKIDKSIEQYKISYAGIYKEKIEIHKELLRHIFGLKLKLQQYQYSGQQALGNELFLDFNKFINYYQTNQPFLSSTIFDGLKAITHELSDCFDNFYMYNNLSGTPGIDPKIRTEALNKFFESGNKFKKDEPFIKIEQVIISEMKRDLKID